MLRLEVALKFTSLCLLISQRKKLRPNALLWAPDIVSSRARKVNLTLQLGSWNTCPWPWYLSYRMAFRLFCCLNLTHGLRANSSSTQSSAASRSSRGIWHLTARERGSAVITECLPCNGFACSVFSGNVYAEVHILYMLLPSSGHNGHQLYSLEQQDFFCFFINLFIYFWLHWVFVAARGPPLVVASGGHSSLRCAGFSLRWPLFVAERGP